MPAEVFIVQFFINLDILVSSSFLEKQKWIVFSLQLAVSQLPNSISLLNAILENLLFDSLVPITNATISFLVAKALGILAINVNMLKN